MTTKSPSAMCSSIIELPVTWRANLSSAPSQSPNVELLVLLDGLDRLAGGDPAQQLEAGRRGAVVGSSRSWIARDMFGSRWISPFFWSALRWHITPLGLLIWNSRPISRTVGP